MTTKKFGLVVQKHDLFKGLNHSTTEWFVSGYFEYRILPENTCLKVKPDRWVTDIWFYVAE